MSPADLSRIAQSATASLTPGVIRDILTAVGAALLSGVLVDVDATIIAATRTDTTDVIADPLASLEAFLAPKIEAAVESIKPNLKAFSVAGQLLSDQAAFHLVPGLKDALIDDVRLKIAAIKAKVTPAAPAPPN